jgi:hypothetical protein
MLGNPYLNLISKNREYRFGIISSTQVVKFQTLSFFWGGLIFIVMKLIATLQSLILENKLIDRFTSNNGQIIDIEANLHSQQGQGTYSNLQRVSSDEILDSFNDIREIVVKQANKISQICDKDNKGCGILVRDNLLGFDYHFWIDKKKSDKLILILNTSIRHPKKLFNREKHNVVIIDDDGDYNILESFTNTKINGKFIQYYLFD